MAHDFLSIVKADQALVVPGFSPQESASAISRAAEYSGAAGGLLGIAKKARTTRWPDLSKAVDGGLQHVISVDNAAGYAELWHKGGSWYAVTGAELSGQAIRKSEDGGHGGIYQIPKVTKGMPIEYAATRFASAIFGPIPLKKGGCNCGEDRSW
jgi:hypothetical protein